MTWNDTNLAQRPQKLKSDHVTKLLEQILQDFFTSLKKLQLPSVLGHHTWFLTDFRIGYAKNHWRNWENVETNFTWLSSLHCSSSWTGVHKWKCKGYDVRNWSQIQTGYDTGGAKEQITVIAWRPWPLTLASPKTLTPWPWTLTLTLQVDPEVCP